MNCPDCRGLIALEVIGILHDEYGDGMPIEEPIFKCPQCKTEYTPEDVIE